MFELYPEREAWRAEKCAASIAKHTTVESWVHGCDVVAAMREIGVSEELLPGAIFEAGRRAGIHAERERRKGGG